MAFNGCIGFKQIDQFRKSYLTLSKAKRATFWITFCSFLQKGISFITLPIFTRLLSVADYGTVSIYSGWESVATYLVTFGVTYGGFNNAMIKFRDDKEGYTSSLLGLILVIGLIWLLVCVTFSTSVVNLVGLPVYLIAFLFIEVISRSVYDIWVSRMKFDYEYRKMVKASLLMGLLCPIAAVSLLILVPNKVVGRIGGFILVELLYAVVLGISLLKKGKVFFNKAYWKFTLIFNIPLLPHYLSQVVLSASDRMMIGQMCSAGDAGIYSIAYSAGMLMTIFTNSLIATVVPWLYRRLNESDFKRISSMSYKLLLIIAAVILGIDILAPDIVTILAPKEYSDAMGLVPVIAASVFFMFIYSYCSNIEFFYEQTRLATIASVSAAGLNLILNYLLIPVFGYRAAGYTTLICYISLALFHYFFAQRVVKKNNGTCVFNGVQIWSIAAIFCVSSLLISYFYHLAFLRYAVVLALLIIAVKYRDLILVRLKEFF